MPQLATNKLAKFNYDLSDRFEAGIILSGPEVKAAKRGDISLRGSYVTVLPDSVLLKNCYIAPYAPARMAQVDYDSRRDRQLLLRRRERSSLIGHSRAQGLTVVPLSFYTKGGFVKVELAVARGKRAVDKREALKKRDVERRIRRAVRR